MDTITTFLHTHILQPDNTISFLGRAYKPTEIFRMVIIIGGYLLLRPYVLKLQARFQENDHAREVDPTEESSHSAMPARRAGSDDEDDDGWGAKLRRRRRREEEERARARVVEEEEDSDAEIEEFLDKE